MEVFRMKKRKLTLTKLFWHYLLTVGISFVCVLVLAFVILLLFIFSNLILPANTAESQVYELEKALSSGYILPSELPSYYRWAYFNEYGQIVKDSNLTESSKQKMYEAVKNKKIFILAFPYNQYHRFLYLPDDSFCVLQYDFSIPYTKKWMQSVLPDFQILLIIFIIVSAFLSILFWTKYYAKRLRSDVMVLTSATHKIMEQKLDTPFVNYTKVKEFDETLQAMDMLRSSLSVSLHEQWNMEQQRMREITALVHDLKTPLTVISGNSELLLEENQDISDNERRSIEAILRNTQRMESYLEKLRSVITQQSQNTVRKNVNLKDIFAEWVSMGEELCDRKRIVFETKEPISQNCHIEVESVNRAILNILDNAVRYTEECGKIYLYADVEYPYLTIVIGDSGTGFTQETIIHACDFFYTDNKSRQSDGHIGMGLYYAKCVAENHQGNLKISNSQIGGVVSLKLKIA